MKHLWQTHKECDKLYICQYCGVRWTRHNREETCLVYSEMTNNDFRRQIGGGNTPNEIER